MNTAKHESGVDAGINYVLVDCDFCSGDGWVTAQPGDVVMGCPFCQRTGKAKQKIPPRSTEGAK
jgi:hypothetical protein